MAVLLLVGPPAALVFALLHGAGNGILTIARGSLPLAIFGPAGYGQRVGILAAPSRMASALAPVAVGMLFDASATTGLFAMVACNLIGFAALFIISTRARD